MKRTRRRKSKAKAKLQIQEEETPRRKENLGHRACWSDSDEPQSKFVKYDSQRAVNFNEDEQKNFETVLGVHRSIVALLATTDGWGMGCSGTVVDHVSKKTWILTSATLVRKPGTQFEVYGHDEIKIEVVLHNKQTVQGFLEMWDLHYNIAVVTIEYPNSQIHLPAVDLSDLPLQYTLQPRPVIALGRDFDSKTFQVRCGELVRESSLLDCKELLVCSCDVRDQNFIGGPIMDSQNRFLGITYSFGETAPFLPVDIAARCMKYFKKKATLPWLRIRGQALHTLHLDVLEPICCKFVRPPSGVLVNKICDTSTENCGGIEVGDIISTLDGVAIYSAAQFTTMFLDKLEVATGTPNIVTVQVVVHRPTDQATFVAHLNVQQVFSDECNKSFQNRWMMWRTYGLGEDL